MVEISHGRYCIPEARLDMFLRSLNLKVNTCRCCSPDVERTEFKENKSPSSILSIAPMFFLSFGALLLMITLHIICHLAAVVMIWSGPLRR